LGRKASDITVADIIYAVDEPLDATQCGGKQNCKDDDVCMTHELWAALSRHMVDFLDSVNLQDLVSEQSQKQSGIGAYSESKTMEVLFKD
jgi:Rrf2 family iron-sulfur cluster assembly transcriptional regulator